MLSLPNPRSPAVQSSGIDRYTQRQLLEYLSDPKNYPLMVLQPPVEFPLERPRILLAELRKYFGPNSAEWKLIKSAAGISQQAHKGQTRNDNKTSYFKEHILKVVKLSFDACEEELNRRQIEEVEKKRMLAQIVAAAFLHDTVEDTDTTLARLRMFLLNQRNDPELVQGTVALTARLTKRNKSLYPADLLAAEKSRTPPFDLVTAYAIKRVIGDPEHDKLLDQCAKLIKIADIISNNTTDLSRKPAGSMSPWEFYRDNFAYGLKRAPYVLELVEEARKVFPENTLLEVYNILLNEQLLLSGLDPEEWRNSADVNETRERMRSLKLENDPGRSGSINLLRKIFDALQFNFAGRQAVPTARLFSRQPLEQNVWPGARRALLLSLEKIVINEQIKSNAIFLKEPNFKAEIQRFFTNCKGNKPSDFAVNLVRLLNYTISFGDEKAPKQVLAWMKDWASPLMEILNLTGFLGDNLVSFYLNSEAYQEFSRILSAVRRELSPLPYQSVNTDKVETHLNSLRKLELQVAGILAASSTQFLGKKNEFYAPVGALQQLIYHLTSTERRHKFTCSTEILKYLQTDCRDRLELREKPLVSIANFIFSATLPGQEEKKQVYYHAYLADNPHQKISVDCSKNNIQVGTFPPKIIALENSAVCSYWQITLGEATIILRQKSEKSLPEQLADGCSDLNSKSLQRFCPPGSPRILIAGLTDAQLQKLYAELPLGESCATTDEYELSRIGGAPFDPMDASNISDISKIVVQGRGESLIVELVIAGADPTDTIMSAEERELSARLQEKRKKARSPPLTKIVQFFEDLAKGFHGDAVEISIIDGQFSYRPKTSLLSNITTAVKFLWWRWWSS